MELDAQKGCFGCLEVLGILRGATGEDDYSTALKWACRSFSLSCAFIYEADYKRTLFVKEKFSAADDYGAPGAISFDGTVTTLSDEDFEDGRLLVFYGGVQQGNPDAVIHILQGIELFVMAPIIEDGKLIAFVGGSDRKAGRRLDSDETRRIASCFGTISTFVKLRCLRNMLSRTRRSLQGTLDNVGVDIYVNDLDTKEVLYVNNSMAAPYGGPDKMLGRKCYEVMYPGQKKVCDFCPQKYVLDVEGNPRGTYVWDYQRQFDRAWLRVSSTAFNWVDGRMAQAVCSVDITENKRNEMLVEHMAYNDALTGIPNRRKFERDFDEVLYKVGTEGGCGVLLFADLDGFKFINDAFGHEIGDILLARVADYLNSVPEYSGCVYRYGGDEFIVMLDGAKQQDIISATEKVIAHCKNPWRIDGKEYYCTMSIGMASYPKNGLTFDQLLTSADSAMYVAKNHGKSRLAVFETASPAAQKIQTEFALRRTVGDGCSEFVLLFNLIVDAAADRNVGAEVLLRWDSPEYGMLMPADFLDVAAKLGLMPQIGGWVIEEGIKIASESAVNWGNDYYISFNISRDEFAGSQFEQQVESACARYAFPRRAIMFEITESFVHSDGLGAKVKRMMAAGYRISIDGFGLNYESTSIVDDLKVDMVKVNKQLVVNCMDSEFDRAHVMALAMMAKAGGTAICAEGVENAETCQYLKQCGYDYLQGTYYSSLLTRNQLSLD